jgi:signal transduction histidine kinase
VHIENYNQSTNRWYDVYAFLYAKDQVGALFRDITERKKAEECLRKSEEDFRALIQASYDVVYRMSPDWKEMRQLRGANFIPDTEEPNRNWTDKYIHPDDQKHVWAVIQHAIDTKSNFELEHRVIRVDGTLGWTFSRAIPLLDKQGNIVEWLGTAKDVTQRKIMEQRLQEKERLTAIGTTAGMVGHDIRNPLQAMMSDIYLMKDEISSNDCKNKETLIESLDSLDANISYINKIVQDLQDYSRPIKPEYSVVDLSNVLVRVFENIGVPDSIKLSIKVNDLEKLWIDPMLLQRALSNLVTNAIQAMPKGGVLEITGYPKNNKAVITVSDTGMGIPNEVKPKLFTPMMTTKSKGQGFGLAVSKRIVEALKGTIGFESEKGKGTKFIIELPTSS